MGMDYSLKFGYGIPFTQVCSKEKKEVTKTRYDENTGKPYEIKEKETILTLWDGKEFEVGSLFGGIFLPDSLVTYLKKKYKLKLVGHGNGPYDAILGVGIGKSESYCGGNPICQKVPNLTEEIALDAIQRLTESGALKVAKEAPALHAILEVSC
jgi:hypothetical protein